MSRMSSPSGIPGDKPISPQGPHEQQETREQLQVKREDIPPGSSREQSNVEQMAADVGREKRKREEDLEKPGDKGKAEVPEPAKKRMAIKEEEKDEEFASLCLKIASCLGEPSAGVNDVAGLADFCFQKIIEKTQSPEPLKTDEIIAIHGLLFGVELGEICTARLNGPINPVNPHPAYIINSLYNCLMRLEGKKCKQARQDYLSQNQLITAYFSVSPAQRTPPFQAVFIQTDQHFMDKLNGASVYTARELFGTENINPAYILHDEQRRRAWVFKPVMTKLSLEEAEMIGMQGAGSGYKPYSSGEPQEMSTYTEHAAYRLNYNKQFSDFFPVPFTCLVEMNGDIGSIQMFVEGQEVAITGPILEEEAYSRDLQAMLIFDLLFINCDRHQGNFLTKKLGIIHRLYAIDHDACLQIGSGRPMKLQYLQHLPEAGFREDVKHLFSPAAIAEYKNIIGQLDVPNAAQLGNWFDYVANELTNPEGKTLSQLAKDIMLEYETNYQD